MDMHVLKRYLMLRRLAIRAKNWKKEVGVWKLEAVL